MPVLRRGGCSEDQHKYHAPVPEQPIAVDPPEMTLRDYVVGAASSEVVDHPADGDRTARLVGMSLSQESRYRSSAEVLVREPPSATAVGAPERPMQQRVLQNELQRAQGSALQDSGSRGRRPEPTLTVRLVADEDTDVFTFTAESVDPARQLVQRTSTRRPTSSAQRRSLVEELVARMSVVDERLENIEVDDPASHRRRARAARRAARPVRVRDSNHCQVSVDLAENSGASLIDAAPVQSTPFAPRPRRSAFLAPRRRTVLGVGAAFIVEHFDTTSETRRNSRR